MNELNYASLEASKKLHEAGIAMRTDYYWASIDMKNWSLCVIPHKVGFKEYPAPSVTELLREMPTETSVEKTDDGYIVPAWKWNRYYCNENPADALIELYMWLEKEKKK